MRVVSTCGVLLCVWLLVLLLLVVGRGGGVDRGRSGDEGRRRAGADCSGERVAVVSRVDGRREDGRRDRAGRGGREGRANCRG